MSLCIQAVDKQLKEYEQIKELMISVFPPNERPPMWFFLWADCENIKVPKCRR